MYCLFAGATTGCKCSWLCPDHHHRHYHHHHHHHQERPLVASALDSALAVALVIAAFDVTGGYFRSIIINIIVIVTIVTIIIIIIMLTNINVLSPVLALGIKLGCGTNDSTQYVSHLVVYWVSLIMMMMMRMTMG